LGILDIKAQINNKTIIDIEMQVENEHNMAERSISYMGKLISNQLQKGEDYKKLKKTILINLLNFNYYKRNSFHSIAHMKFENTTKESYVDMKYEKEDILATQIVEMHFIEIPKFIKKNPDTKAKINQWVWLLSGEGEKIKMAEKENKKVKRAVETLDEISMSPEERERYDSILLAEFNYKTSMYNIREEEKKEIAKKMLLMGLSKEQAQEATNLEAAEIKEVIAEFDEKEKELYEARQRGISEYNNAKYIPEEGKKEVEKRKQTEIAEKLLEMGLSNNQIKEATGISNEELEEITKSPK